MSLLHTYKVYNPITLLMGCLFVGVGMWLLFELVRHGVQTTAGIFVIVVFAALPISIGAAIIHNQLQLRRNSTRS
jgi:TRAP-type C4-dicarboxylate transport system permease small subunit